MPHLDKRTGELVVRVVYDGPPEAGKTTNIRSLTETIALQRRGRVASPGTQGRRTEFFDWLDFAGGYVDGRRLRCQLLSVPGQPKLLRRRRYLLESADAVVFVADARPEALDENRESLILLREILRKCERGQLEIGLVLQANKQDLLGALSAEALSVELGMEVSVPSLAARADVGTGVTETFMTGVRLAVDRVRATSRMGLLVQGIDDTVEPDALYRTLLEVDRNEAEPPPEGSTPSLHPTLRPVLLGTRDAPAPEWPKPAPLPVLAPQSEPGSDASSAVSFELLPPDPLCIPAGCAWPPVRSRAILEAGREACRVAAEQAAVWRPPGSEELRGQRGLRMHSRQAWLFEDPTEGRRVLRSVVRSVLALGRRAPRERAFALAPDGAAWRLWVATGELPTLADELQSAIAGGEQSALYTALAKVVRVASDLRQEPPASELPVRLSLHTLVEAGSSAVIMALPLPDEADRPPATLWDELRELLARHAGSQPFASRLLLACREVERSAGCERESRHLARLVDSCA